MDLHLNIKKRRLELNLSQQDLAELMGYKSRSTIARIEAGENDISQKKLLRFAEILDTSAEALLFGVSAKEQSVSSVGPTWSKTDKGYRRNSKNSEMKAVIVLAGGKSTRNMQNIPNQFINVLGKPILVYCLEAYQKHPLIDEIFVVCLKGWEDILQAYAHQYNISKLRGITSEGKSGVLSARNGLELCANYSDNDIVVLQESTRPMVTEEMISKVLLTCKKEGNAIACETMQNLIQFCRTDNGIQYMPRDNVVAMQSPEAYRIGVLKAAFRDAENAKHDLMETCCGMMMYNLGHSLRFCKVGNNNMKVVRQEDIAILKALLKEYD